MFGLGLTCRLFHTSSCGMFYASFWLQYVSMDKHHLTIIFIKLSILLKGYNVGVFNSGQFFRILDFFFFALLLLCVT